MPLHLLKLYDLLATFSQVDFDLSVRGVRASIYSLGRIIRFFLDLMGLLPVASIDVDRSQHHFCHQSLGYRPNIVRS